MASHIKALIIKGNVAEAFEKVAAIDITSLTEFDHFGLMDMAHDDSIISFFGDFITREFDIIG